LCGGQTAHVRAFMQQLREAGTFSVSKVQLATGRQLFTADRADDEETLQTIRDVYKESGYVLDPHSAVGVCVARKLARELPEPIVMLACAHPAKFPDTIKRAIGEVPAVPKYVADLLKKPERTVHLPARVDEVEKFMAAKVSA